MDDPLQVIVPDIFNHEMDFLSPVIVAVVVFVGCLKVL